MQLQYALLGYLASRSLKLVQLPDAFRNDSMEEENGEMEESVSVNEISAASSISDVGENVSDEASLGVQVDLDDDSCTDAKTVMEAEMDGDDSISTEENSMQIKTYRHQLPTYEAGSYSPFRVIGKKKSYSHRQRNPRSKNPYVEFKKCMWWEIRAQMPDLNRFEIDREVSNRWRALSQEMKDTYRPSCSKDGGGDQSDVRDRLRRSQERLKSIRQRGRSVESVL